MSSENSDLGECLYRGVAGNALQAPKSGDVINRLQINQDGTAKIYRSINGGVSFSEEKVVTTTNLSRNPITLTYGSQNNTAIFEQVGDAVAMSTSSGATIRRLQLNPDGTLHIFSSVDGGNNWSDRPI